MAKGSAQSTFERSCGMEAMGKKKMMDKQSQSKMKSNHKKEGMGEGMSNKMK